MEGRASEWADGALCAGSLHTVRGAVCISTSGPTALRLFEVVTVLRAKDSRLTCTRPLPVCRGEGVGGRVGARLDWAGRGRAMVGRQRRGGLVHHPLRRVAIGHGQSGGRSRRAALRVRGTGERVPGVVVVGPPCSGGTVALCTWASESMSHCYRAWGGHHHHALGLLVTLQRAHACTQLGARSAVHSAPTTLSPGGAQQSRHLLGAR